MVGSQLALQIYRESDINIPASLWETKEKPNGKRRCVFFLVELQNRCHIVADKTRSRILFQLLLSCSLSSVFSLPFLTHMDSNGGKYC